MARHYSTKKFLYGFVNDRNVSRTERYEWLLAGSQNGNMEYRCVPIAAIHTSEFERPLVS
jgi:hypothetical protein